MEDTTETPNSTTTTTPAPTDAPVVAPAPAVDAPAPDAPVEPAPDTLDTPGLLDGEPKPDGHKPAEEPKPDADAEKPAALVGDVPEAYELKAPEGRTIDPEAAKLFEPIFKEIGLTNDGAQKFVDAAPAFVDHVAQGVRADIEANVVATRKAWAEEAMKDPEIGGAQFEQSKALAAKVFDRFGLAPDGAFRTLLKDSGLGNHPDMIRTMVKMAKAIGEDGFERSDAGDNPNIPVWDRVYGGPTPA